MVRIKDVAEAVGVSTATVSNVINGKDQRVSGEVRERIQKALDEMGYVRSDDAGTDKFQYDWGGDPGEAGYEGYDGGSILQRFGRKSGGGDPCA